MLTRRGFFGRFAAMAAGAGAVLVSPAVSSEPEPIAGELLEVEAVDYAALEAKIASLRAQADALIEKLTTPIEMHIKIDGQTAFKGIVAEMKRLP